MSWIWWIIGGAVLLGLLSGGNKNSRRSGSSGGPVRIDHPHYIDVDEYECSRCGAKFRKNSMTCPKCGARFRGTKEDDDEFIEEMVLWDDDD